MFVGTITTRLSNGINPDYVKAASSWRCEPSKISIYCKFCEEMIEDVEFYPPATKVTFKDGKVITNVARNGDEFSKEYGILACIVEYMCGGKNYNNILRHWIKNDERRKAEIASLEEKERQEKEVQERQAAKRAKRKAERIARAKEREIEIQKEAYIRAMKEMNEVSKDDVNAGFEE